MKRTILSLTLALMASCMFGQTVEKLFEKYKAISNATYEENTEEMRTAVEEAVKQKLGEGEGEIKVTIDEYNVTPNELDMTLTGFKKGEQLLLMLNDEQKQTLEQDILSLKGYETMFTMNDNSTPSDTTTILARMMGQMFSPSYQLYAYGKGKGKKVSDVLLVWNIWNSTVLGRFEGKMSKDKFVKTLANDTFALYSNGHEDGKVVSYDDVLKDVKNGKVLFVINGEQHSEFQSIDEAREYMISSNIHWNSESWIVGAAVKEKYPDTDMKVVVEWSEKDLKEKEKEHEKR